MNILINQSLINVQFKVDWEKIADQGNKEHWYVICISDVFKEIDIHHRYSAEKTLSLDSIEQVSLRDLSDVYIGTLAFNLILHKMGDRLPCEVKTKVKSG